ncbi:MAG: hypothetical protein V9E94_12320 [Microthrixaceae bacterium]
MNEREVAGAAGASLRSIVPGTPKAAGRVWLLNGMWRGGVSGATTPIVFAGVVWAGSLSDTQADPDSITSTTSFSSSSLTEVASYIAAAALYALLATSIGSVTGLLLGVVVGAMAATLDVASGCRLRPTLSAGVVILGSAGGAWWAVVGLDPDGPVVVRLAAMAPFAVGFLSLAVVRMERSSANESMEQELGERGTASQL